MQTEVPVYINYGVVRFAQMFQQFAKFIDTVPLSTFRRTVDQEPAGIIVSPRNNSGIPFCNITLALLYASRGLPVTIIWDDQEFLDPEWELQNRCVGELIRFVCQNSVIDSIQLSRLEPAAIDPEDEAYLRKIGFNNAVWNVRDIVPGEALDTYSRLSFEAMCNNAGRIKQLYATRRFDHCVHQSLLNNNGGVHKYFANQSGRRVSCFDMSHGRGMIGLNDVQGYYYDVLPLVDEQSPFYLFGNEAFKEAALESARADHQRRFEGKDSRSTQPAVGEARDLADYDVVIPLNIFWDVSALGRNRLFDSPHDWLVQTISYILENTLFSVAVRQHPHEVKFKQFATGDLLGKDLTARFGKYSRFRFINSEEKVNTYRLIERARVVLPYTSTLGIEAALMGKPVIVESNVYYADQPFVYKAESVDDYFEHIERAEHVRLSEEAEQMGWLLYFLTSQTPFLYSSFGLVPPDIQRWTAAGFDALAADEMMGVAIECLATNTPLPYVNGRRILEEILHSREKVHDAHIAYHS